MNNENQFTVAVIGAGPAGLFAARQLASDGIEVAVINRDIKPGGLAEYGIYPTKYKMKQGLRRQFKQILEQPKISYFGNITVGEKGDLTLNHLKELGFQAILVTVGAQGTKWLGLPGEELARGVYHAKDLVYHYNNLPPFSEREFFIGERAALIGVGNVSLDITRWLIRTLKIKEVVAVARRGPAEVKFDKKEMEYVIANLDQEELEAEIARVAPVMNNVGQDVEAAKEFILAALPKALEPVSSTRFYFDFLASPKAILGDDHGQVCGLEIEETKLVPFNGDTKARGTGVKRVLNVDTVIFCIGDRVDENFGLPIAWNEFIKNPNPSFPVDGVSYEVYDKEKEKPIEGIFVAGWSREASHGLVGLARKDGERGAHAVLQYLETLPPPASEPDVIIKALRAQLTALHKPIIENSDVEKLSQAELAQANKLGIEDFKYPTNEEMLQAMGFN